MYLIKKTISCKFILCWDKQLYYGLSEKVPVTYSENRENLNSDLPHLKGLGHDWWSLFIISFYLNFLYISSRKPSLNRTTIFKLIVHGIELHTAFEERENKQKNVKF